jgi:hypothetical protein
MPYCVVNGTSLQPTVVLMGRHAGGNLPFQIDQLRGPTPLETVEIVARFATSSKIIAAIRKNDVDHGLYINPLAAGATVLDVTTRSLNADTSQADVRLRLNAERGSNGWVYASLPLRAGADFAFRNGRYQVNGPVLSISPEWTAPK